MINLLALKILKLYTVQFPYLETGGVRKWVKIKRGGGIEYEPSTCLMARDVSEKIAAPKTAAARALGASTVTVM